jgi:DNA-binding NarL/FixJ family response regulator
VVTPVFSVHGSSSVLSALLSALIEITFPKATIRDDADASQVVRYGDVVVKLEPGGRKLVVFGGPPDPGHISDYLASGAHSLVGLDASREELTTAIRCLIEGPPFVASGIVQRLAAQPSFRNTSVHLSARECEIVELVVRGLSNREIAEQLGLSPNTVRSHLQSISGKLSVSNRARIAFRAREIGIV